MGARRGIDNAAREAVPHPHQAENSRICPVAFTRRIADCDENFITSHGALGFRCFGRRGRVRRSQASRRRLISWGIGWSGGDALNLAAMMRGSPLP